MTSPILQNFQIAKAGKTYQQLVLEDSPLAFWGCNDAFGASTLADASGNGRSLTLNGSRNLQAGARNSRLGRSVAFRSNTGYAAAASAAWHQITGDCTLECWVNVPDAATTVLTLMSCSATGSGSANNRLYQWALLTVSTVKGVGTYHEHGSNLQGANTFQAWTWTVRRWHHLVCVRDTAALTYAFYADGVLLGTQSYATNPDGGTSGEFNINRVADGNQQIGTAAFDGCAVYNTKLSADRIFEHYRAGRRDSGTAWENTVFLCNFEGADAATAIPDNSSFGRTITFNGNAQLDTAQAPAGLSSSLLLDGTGDFLTTSDSADLEIAGQVFTIEAFVRLNSTGRTQTICGKRDTSSAEEHTLAVDSSDHLSFQAFSGGSAIVTLNGSASAMTTGVWYHVVAQRIAGNTWTLHRDGVLVASASSSSSAQTNAQGWTIGRDNFNTGRDWDGWIGPMRVTHGSSRYPAANFTPPTGPFPLYQ